MKRRKGIIGRGNAIFLPVVCYLLFAVASGCSTHSEEVRKPVFAGHFSFYPADKVELKRMIGNFLKNVPDQKIEGNLLGLIVPHAGYIYSGQVAAYSFKLLDGRHFETVILIGPSHKVRFDDISIYPRGFWETPLGRVAIDEKIAGLLMKKSGRIRSYPPAHQREHSLEVELPFLQMTLKDFKIVPLVMGNPSPQNYHALADAILAAVRESRSASILIIASSDMSHFHPYGKACLMDGLCLGDIESLDVKKLQGDLSKRSVELCGAGPVLALMEIANKLNATAKILKYANSGDVPAGDKGSVVGYCAVAFYISSKVGRDSPIPTEIRIRDFVNSISPVRRRIGGGKIPHLERSGSPAKESAQKSPVKPQKDRNSTSQSKGVPMLNKNQQKRLLEIARKTLEDYIRRGKTPEFKESDSQLTEKRGAFVTLTKKGQLRGCIGYIQPVLPLSEAISEMAIKSSTEDPRFLRVKPEELTNIHIEISVLSPLELINDVKKIEVGKHGLIIRKGHLSGLLLPQVATDYGWDKWQFLDQTCVKAGLPPGSWKDKDVQIYIFGAHVFGEE